jgi:hypothetical protein
VIVSDLPPSGLFGSLATSVHTPAFKCFISTAKTALFSNKWSSKVFAGDPGVSAAFSVYGSVEFREGLSNIRLHAAHTELSKRLDSLGEEGLSLGVAVEEIFNDFEK